MKLPMEKMSKLYHQAPILNTILGNSHNDLLKNIIEPS